MLIPKNKNNEVVKHSGIMHNIKITGDRKN